ncbi:MAG: hypothetical protein HZB62_16245 [Nitrospirae bacterium]|nr:hypothetical protein [Nitrospirota bacterium]
MLAHFVVVDFRALGRALLKLSALARRKDKLGYVAVSSATQYTAFFKAELFTLRGLAV